MLENNNAHIYNPGGYYHPNLFQNDSKCYPSRLLIDLRASDASLKIDINLRHNFLSTKAAG